MDFSKDVKPAEESALGHAFFKRLLLFWFVLLWYPVGILFDGYPPGITMGNFKNCNNFVQYPWGGLSQSHAHPLGSTLGGPYSSKAQPLGVHPTPITMLLGNSHVLNGVWTLFVQFDVEPIVDEIVCQHIDSYAGGWMSLVFKLWLQALARGIPPLPSSSSSSSSHPQPPLVSTFFPDTTHYDEYLFFNGL